VITPWDVSGGADGKVDYNKLTEQVGRYMVHHRHTATATRERLTSLAHISWCTFRFKICVLMLIKNL
jgi:hypothetical protein